jgi:hypothetical protein
MLLSGWDKTIIFSTIEPNLSTLGRMRTRTGLRLLETMGTELVS